MTEYDFSPEAYDRFMHTQQRIANWVDHTEEHRPQFGSTITPSTQLGTPPSMSPRSLHERRSYSMRERRRPSLSSSSDSASTSSTHSSTDSSNAPQPPMPAFQPMYLQHPLPDPLASNRPHHSNHQRRHTDHHYSSHDRSLPRSLSYGTPVPQTAAPQIYGHNIGHSSSGGHTVLPQLKGMSLVTSPPQTPYYQPTPSYSGKHSYPTQRTIYPPAVLAGGPYPSLPLRQPRQLIKPIYSDQPASNSQYPGPPTIYPLTAYGPSQPSMQRPVMYQRVFRDVSASGRRKGSGRSRSGRRSR